MVSQKINLNEFVRMKTTFNIYLTRGIVNSYPWIKNVKIKGFIPALMDMRVHKPWPTIIYLT